MNENQRYLSCSSLEIFNQYVQGLLKVVSFVNSKCVQVFSWEKSPK